MRKITQIIRLHFEAKLSTRQIAASLKVSVGVVSKYVNRALDSNISWPLPSDMDEKTLEASLYLIYPEYLPILNYRQQSGEHHGTRNSFYCTML